MRALALSLLLVAAPAHADDDLRAWVGVGGRNAIGPTYADFGVYAMAGVWLAGEHVQPFARIGWSQGGGDRASIDAARLGAGIAFGAPLLRDHLWLGAAGAFEGMAVLSQAGGEPQWLGMVALSGIAQLRVWQRFLVGVEAGVDVFPTVLRSPAGNLEWDTARFNAGLRLGVILGAPVK
jgi:hypothetical protein